jgi:ABC-2 type transport system permease protein
MNGHIRSVFFFELIRNLRRKGFLFATFGIPVVGFVILMGIQTFVGNSTEDDIAELEFDINGITSAGYVDYSGMFPKPGQFAEDYLTKYGTEEEAQAALDSGDIESYYVIAQDYKETGDVLLVTPRFSVNQIMNGPALIEGMFYGQWVEDVDIGTLVRLRAPSVIEQIEFAQDEEGVTRDEDADFVLVYGFSLIFLIALFGTNGYLMHSVIEEKETRLIEILISSVRPGQLLTGKILAMSLLGLLQVVVYVTTAIILTQISSNSSALVNTFANNLEIPIGKLPILLVYFVLAYLFFAAGFGAVGALSNSMSEGPNLTLIFVLPAVVPFYFLSVFLEDPNGTLPVILSLFPITAPIAMIMRVSMVAVPFIQIAVSLVLLSLMVLGMFWLAGRLFRMQTLLAGNTPTFRDIPKLLRS